jgi:D-serine deaminase-like pyridoxal phosphate-dependent protein
VGLPRCGCAPDEAGRIADLARKRGLTVRGVMGYEGHVVGMATRAERKAACDVAMAKLRAAHERVGGDVVSAGGTGTFDLNDVATEIQAGSYSLMDTHYAARELPFRLAFFVWSTVISRGPAWLVCDAGLKSLGMDHGNPTIDGAKVWFCSDEHVTFSSDTESKHPLAAKVGDRVRVWPAHIDPTLAYHDRLHLADGDAIVDVWPIDLRGW